MLTAAFTLRLFAEANRAVSALHHRARPAPHQNLQIPCISGPELSQGSLVGGESENPSPHVVSVPPDISQKVSMIS